MAEFHKTTLKAALPQSLNSEVGTTKRLKAALSYSNNIEGQQAKCFEAIVPLKAEGLRWYRLLQELKTNVLKASHHHKATGLPIEDI